MALNTAPLKTAMILAAGRGERLRPITDHTPKPLVQVGDATLLDHHLRALDQAGFERVVVNLGHLGSRIKAHLETANYTLQIRFSPEPAGALETAGGIARALEQIDDERFLVINGDIRTDADLSLMQLPEDSALHLWLVDNPIHHPDGDFGLDRSTTPGRLIAGKSAEQTWTYSGIGSYRASLFSDLPAPRYPLAPVIAHCIANGDASGEVFRGNWIDIGTVERLRQANQIELVRPHS